jgi:hypothetical protein
MHYHDNTVFKRAARSTVVILAIFLTACGASTEPEGVIPKSQLEALERAGAVEDILLDAQKKRLKEVDG